MIDLPIPGESKSETWAETLALFPHPYLKVSDHLSRDDTKGNGTAEPVVAHLTVREVMPPCLSLPGGAFDHVHVDANTRQFGDNHGDR